MDKLQTTIYGMTLDQVFFQRKPGVLSYAMNANIQSKDGRGITYTNEYSNQLCVEFPYGFIVIGTKLVLSKNEIIFALVNPSSGESEIGRVKNFNCNSLTVDNIEYDCQNCRGKQLQSIVRERNACCEYERIVRAKCLNFHIDYPVRMIYKITNCGYKLYLTDNYNEPRYLNLDDFANGTYIGKDDCNDPIPFDCERIKIFKDFCIPQIQAVTEESGGNLQAGVYQATIAYCDANGQEYTEYFDHTNPVPVFERTITNDTDYYTAKSIRYSITHNTDVFEYFKMVIIKTVNETSDYLEAGIFRVTPTNNITFGENDKSLVDSSINKITTPKPDYTKAKLIEESGNYLLLCDLEDSPEYNFQPFANQMKLYWETVNMPYDSNNNYSNPIVVSRFRGYMRDEVYPFAIRFKLKNGKRTKAFHIPNRLASQYDLDPISNDDVISDDGCSTIDQKPRWKVYNTAYNPCDGSPCCSYSDKYPQESFPGESRICDIVRGCYGEFAYWESTETYPCDDRIWGDLAGKPIRYHKFPDSVINHIHDSFVDHLGNLNYDINHKSIIHPIGVRLDESIFNDLLSRTFIYDPKTGKTNIPMKDLVCGFEIVRGNRVGNKSIIAKGLLYDVGRVNERSGADNQNNVRSYYMPNYPYNDIRPNDPYLSKNAEIYTSPDPDGSIEDKYRLSSYPTNWVQRGPNDFRRFTFHGPDVHFQKPSLGTNLKIETEELGLSEGHFVQVQDHPRYKFLTKFDMSIATKLGVLGGLKIGTEEETETDATPTAGLRERGKATLEFNYSDFLNTSELVRDLFEKSIPKRNFAYAYHSRGVYNNYEAIPNDGGKIRSLEIAKYLSPNNQNLGDDASVFNYNRESSVYLKVNQAYRDYKYPEYSRYTLSSHSSTDDDYCKHPEEVKSAPIRSFYSSVRREVPDQYGRIENVSYISTGYSITLKDGQFSQTYYPIFGGDTFINKFALKRKMPFFTQNMVGRPDEIDFDYNLVPNFAFPTYYIGTSPDELELKNVINGVDIALLITGVAGLIFAQTAPPNPAGGPPPFPPIPGYVAKVANTVAMTALTAGGADIYRKMMGAFIAKNNLDCDTTPANFDPLDPNDWRDFGDYTFFYQSGKFYLASYGIPNFFVESDINVEYRYGRNEKEENFYPNVGNDIPDNWLQEKNVPIQYDNYYSYNATYSVQNYQQLIEPYIGKLFDKPCQSSFPNRIIYSEKANNEENSDNWLKFGSDNYYDFEKANGEIVGINGLDNNRLMVRFENNFQLWNTRITLPSSSPLQVSLSNSGMFTQDPLEFTKAYLGYGGSQHYAFEQTRVGNFWVDAKRGVVFRFTTQMDEISQTNYNWFKENLPFNILKSVPNVNVDNSFKDIGLSICWDERFQRLFITKKDYKVVSEYEGQIFWEDVNGRKQFVRRYLDVEYGLVTLNDPTYFENKSFTIAWSPIINNWVSFYSFLPNYYVSLTNHFQTGVHDGFRSTLWNHGLSNLSYQIYYNKLYPYILEIPISNIPQSEILKSVTVHTDIMRYTSETDFYSIKSVNKENYNIFFTKAIIYNKEQCTGTLNLVETPINNLYLKSQYPKFNTDSVDVLYAKYDKVCTFNTFFDAVRDHGSGQPIFTNEWDSIQSQYPIDKVLNTNNLRYSSRYMKQPLKSNECYVRLIQDAHSRYKFVNTFDIMQQENKNQ